MLQTKSIEFQLQDLRFVGKWDSPWFTCIHYRFNKHRPLSSYQIGYLDGPFLDTALPWASRTACSAKHSLMKSLGSLGDSFASKDGFERASSRGFLKWNHNLRTKKHQKLWIFPKTSRDLLNLLIYPCYSFAGPRLTSQKPRLWHFAALELSQFALCYAGFLMCDLSGLSPTYHWSMIDEHGKYTIDLFVPCWSSLYSAAPMLCEPAHLWWLPNRRSTVTTAIILDRWMPARPMDIAVPRLVA
jgi:hypothetical protein